MAHGGITWEKSIVWYRLFLIILSPINIRNALAWPLAVNEIGEISGSATTPTPSHDLRHPHIPVYPVVIGFVRVLVAVGIYCDVWIVYRMHSTYMWFWFKFTAHVPLLDLYLKLMGIIIYFPVDYFLNFKCNRCSHKLKR